MAEKRMFSRVITESDAFLDLPLSTQALYFHLCMYADDDGFLSGYRKIMRMVGASQNEYDLLVAKRFVLQFDDGIVLIKHWLMHNYLRKDRYNPSVYTTEKSMVFIKSNKSYTLDSEKGVPALECHGTQVGTPVGIPVVDVDKSSIEESSIDKSSEEDTPKKTSRFTPPTVEQVADYCKERSNDINAEYFIDYQEARGWVLSNGKKMKDWKATIRTWERNANSKKPNEPKQNGKVIEWQ